MIQRQMWTSLGLGALSIAFIALPGSSNTTTSPSSATAASQSFAQEVSQLPIRVNPKVEIRTNPQGDEMSVVVDDDEDGGALVRGTDDPQNAADDENLQVFMGTGGGWLGVGVAEVSSERMKALKLPEERGAMLGKIVPESPAAKAGLKENDVVLEINGQRIEGTEQFRRMIHEIPAGRTANLTVWREGRSQNIKVTLGKQDAGNMKLFAGGPKSFAFKMPTMPAMPDLSGLEHLRTFSMISPGHPLLGIDAENLEGEFGNYFGAPNGEGVLVRGVFANSAAAKAGLKVGDVITSLNGERVHNASELREKLLTSREAKNLKLGILRNKSELTLSVELPQQKEEEEHFLSERTNV
ncbi:MAG TPA: PDZ domain-containing protein [Candidatus Sulfotelmatobacter sp.]|jgi:serine protease Do|nr:PDZ domain-containing protein [Candidatus Sulfotelmatobacter sp.]